MKYEDIKLDIKAYEYVDSESLLPYQLELWRKQLGFYVDLYQKFCNPFRIDKNPNCWLYEYNGIIHLADFADQSYHGWTIFHTVVNETNFQKKCQYLYHEVLPTINVPLDQLFYQKTINSQRASIDWKTRNFCRKDEDFWFYGGITKEQLLFENLYPLQTYKVNDVEIYPDDITYGYNINDGKKVYRPYNDKYKWTSNMTIKHIGGNKPITHDRFEPRFIIITKSLKDYCVFINMGYNCRYIINEGADLTLGFLNYLDKNFDFVFFCLDNDKAGKKAIIKYQTMWQSFIGNEKFFSLLIPEEEDVTDIFDFSKKYNLKTSELIISEQIETIWNIQEKI